MREGTRFAQIQCAVATRLAALVLVLTLAGSAGCVVAPRTVHTVGHVAAAALWTAAVIGTVSVMTYHDEHFHHDHCGHYRRWHDGRWVYYYGDRWEYYDESSASWYFYAEG